jgi:hypothetical protein
VKYIRLEGGGFVVFPDSIAHNEVVVKGGFQNTPCNAGKIQIVVREGKLSVHTYGESISLKLTANKEDGEAIRRMIEEY